MSSTAFPLTGIASSETFGVADLTYTNVVQFRSDFPEFANEVSYPDSSVLMFLNLAAVLLANQCRWASLLTIGTELVTAHYLVLQARDLAAAAAGGVPGTPTGLQTAKSVGDVSVSYDYSRTTMEGAGFWNLTTYGQRFWQMARMIGAGGLQVSGCNWGGWSL